MSLCVELYEYVEVHDENMQAFVIDSIMRSCMNVI